MAKYSYISLRVDRFNKLVGLDNLSIDQAKALERNPAIYI